jgi:hypothetical protein
MMQNASLRNPNTYRETLESVDTGTVDWDAVMDSLREYGFGLLNERPLSRVTRPDDTEPTRPMRLQRSA